LQKLYTATAFARTQVPVDEKGPNSVCVCVCIVTSPCVCACSVNAFAPAQVPVDEKDPNSVTRTSTEYYDMWKGFCEANIRAVVTYVECFPDAYAELVHPFQVCVRHYKCVCHFIGDMSLSY